MAVRAVLDLDLPSCDAEFLSACGEVAGGCAWADKMVPAVLAGENGDAQFGDTHDGDVWVES